MSISILKDKLYSKAWVYLPEADILSKYFKQNDLIELSKVCQKYRAQLKPQVLKKLLINYRILELLNISPLYNSNGFEDIINCLRFGFAGDYHLVKQVALDISLTTKFAYDLFSLFDKSLNIKILSRERYNLKGCIEVLNNLKNLQHITLSSEFDNFNSVLDDECHNLFYKLKSIEIYVPSTMINEESPFDIIDSSFTNLKSLTIVNNHILYKLSNGMPSLLIVKFYYGYQFDTTELNKFFCSNPQLKQIYISSINLDENVINSILALKNLYKLELMFLRPKLNDFNIYMENYSIKHFIYTGSRVRDYNVSIGVLKMCKNLKVYETSSISNYDSVIGSEFPKIGILLLRDMFYCDIDILSEKFTRFNQVKFRDGCKFEYIADQLLNYPDIEWVPKQEYTRGTNEFTLVRKLV
jgi:hypothetical protein